MLYEQTEKIVTIADIEGKSQIIRILGISGSLEACITVSLLGKNLDAARIVADPVISSELQVAITSFATVIKLYCVVQYNRYCSHQSTLHHKDLAHDQPCLLF